jgi:hypothetical protein
MLSLTDVDNALIWVDNLEGGSERNQRKLHYARHYASEEIDSRTKHTLDYAIRPALGVKTPG